MINIKPNIINIRLIAFMIINVFILDDPILDGRSPRFNFFNYSRFTRF